MAVREFVVTVTLPGSLVFKLRSLQCILTPIITLNDFIFQVFLFVYRGSALSSAVKEDKGRRTACFY